MQILTTPQETHQQCAAWRKEGLSIGLVPTMGFFHEGHESLMRAARAKADKVVVSLFVNPTQFGEGEDYAAYPRDSVRDAEIAEKNDCDLLFMPTPETMYNPDHQTWVEVPDMAKGLCGASRPGHFRGVCTIVLKLIMICEPTFVFLGEKDWQQQAIIRRMASDLNLPVKIVSVPIVREKDGLAKSSRNTYLSERDRKSAPLLYQGLLKAQANVQAGETDSARLKEEVLVFWQDKWPEAKVDYIAIVHPETLQPLPFVEQNAVMACAVGIGSTRLIDNLMLIPNAES